MRMLFDNAVRVPAPSDNVAIACRRLEGGTQLDRGGDSFTVKHTVLEGHRLACSAIAKNECLTSWGLPFGRALRDIAVGEYVCNATMLTVLDSRHVKGVFPDTENFTDHNEPYQFVEGRQFGGAQVLCSDAVVEFEGYLRGGNRGVGTRNFIVILGTSSLASSFVRMLAQKFQDVPTQFSNVDGVVPVAHTEGGDDDVPNNLEFVLRVLSGFMVHPNVGAVLAVDSGEEAINNRLLKRAIRDRCNCLDPRGWPPYVFMSLTGESSLQAALDKGASVVRRWLQPLNCAKRSRQSAAHLKLALQCGGSDAFSGISGNPLIGWVAKEVIRCGGSANLAETDELIGAEQYILHNVRDRETAQAFIDRIQTFKRRVGLHGHTAEGNPSGGNRLRGLYNIVVKSIGAARKKDPQVRLDFVIDYGEAMSRSGFYFMDSPGNDLESIAGQVASGANLILFTTGNGSITNFPFVPTIKIVTTTNRYNLVRNEMDVNAGRYQDGMSMDQLGADTFKLAMRIASGQHSAGENAGHSQVQLWRNWRQTEEGQNERVCSNLKPTGQPMVLKPISKSLARFNAYRTVHGFACDQVGAVVPTSLCSSQIARLIVDRLNTEAWHVDALSRYVTFVHTEGCGVSGGQNERMYMRTLIGYATHPMVKCGLLLEHGCEMTHNDAMRNYLSNRGIDPDQFGWASVQLDGGIERVMNKVKAWFSDRAEIEKSLVTVDVGLEHLRLGLTMHGQASEAAMTAMARLAATVVACGGTVVVPQGATLLGEDLFPELQCHVGPEVATLAYGECASLAGFHVMETPTEHSIEMLTGLGATGVDVILAHVAERPLQAHPMIPLIQVASNDHVPDIDMNLDSFKSDQAISVALLKLVLRVASREYTPKLFGQGYTDFQMTRGLLGVSL